MYIMIIMTIIVIIIIMFTLIDSKCIENLIATVMTCHKYQLIL